MIVFSHTSAPDESSSSALFNALLASTSSTTSTTACVAAPATSTAISAMPMAREARDCRSIRPGSTIVCATSNVVSTAGPIQFGARLKRSGSSSGTTIATSNVSAGGQRLSPRTSSITSRATIRNRVAEAYRSALACARIGGTGDRS
jgi:hypothetical protein